MTADANNNIHLTLAQTPAVNINSSIELAGENALIIYFSQYPADAAALVAQADQLIRNNLAGDVVDLIPSYASILVMFDMSVIDHHQLKSKLRSVLINLTVSESSQGDLVELPVYYSVKSGPDLFAIATKAKLTVEEVIAIHQAQEYRVYAIGFAPGFAYLGEVDPRIQMPRLTTPRLKVPKGAVAIADRQTAVYPSVSPGGWNIIGLCPVTMFNLEHSPIMPVKVGDKVRFKAISKQEYIALGGALSTLISGSVHGENHE